MPRIRKNQLKPEYLGLQNLNSFTGNDSASRKQMAAGNVGQALPLINADLPDFITGTEVQYGLFQFNTKMPEAGVITDVIDDIGPSSGGGLVTPTNRLVIYENIDTNKYDCFTVPAYISHHKLFGAPLYPTAEAKNLRATMAIRKGVHLNRTSDHHENGEIMLGRPARTAFITLPGVVEDGIIISEDYSKACSFYCYEKRTFSIGREYYPLNSYGSGEPGNPYKMAPDVGEKVNEDGTLVALRKRSSRWASLDMTRDRTRRPNRTFDRIIRATPGAEIVNVEVYHDADQRQTNLPSETATYIERYDLAKRRRNNRLIELYRRLEKDNGGRAPMSKELHAEIKRALMYNNPLGLPGRRLCYKKDDLDEYRITITFRYILQAGMAVKMTCLHGGKGVVCEIRKTEDMPKDKYGRPLDMVTDPMSLTKRMNLGKVIEPRLSSTSIEYTRLIRESLGFDDVPCNLDVARKAIRTSGEEWVNEWFDKLLGYYKLISPRQYQGLFEYGQEDKIEHLAHCVAIKVRVWLPTDNPVVYADAHPELQANHPVNKDVMSFNTFEGIPVFTKGKVTVGNVTNLVLEKIGRELSAVSSTRVLSNGVPGRMSASDKGTGHIRTNAVRLPSETDLRWMLMAMPPIAVRDLQERGNAPEIHEELYESILTAENPMQIESAIDRNRFHRNHNRIAKQVKQLQMCNGVKISRTPTPTLAEVKRANTSSQSIA